ncbi:MAG: hypothetical protein ACI8S6_002327 [Myxococcota bacterium]|jgi:hypothetical protein
MSLLPFFALVSASALAGNRTVNSSGAALGWQLDVVPYTIDPDGKHGLDVDEVVDAINTSAAQWQLEGSWIELVYEGEVDADESAYNDIHEIFFVDEWSAKLDPNLLALTYVWSQSDGEILHFDIAINADDHAWGTAGEEDRNDLSNAMTHEFGHALGFDHSEIEEATMFSRTSTGETSKRDLAEDDMALFADLYGGSFPFSELGGMSCSTVRGGPAGLAAALSLLVVFARRRADTFTVELT